MANLRVFRAGVWLAVAVIVVAVGGLFLTRHIQDTAVADRSAGAGQTATFGGPFTLTNQMDATVTQAALQGQASALYFGYTYCPDVCPTTLANITTWLNALGTDAGKLKVYFITVDPERDSRQVMGEYLTAFDPRIIGLTGDRPAIDQILKDYHVYAKKIPGANGAPYTMDHSASILLLDSKANLVSTIDYGEASDVALGKLKRLVSGNG